MKTKITLFAFILALLCCCGSSSGSDKHKNDSAAEAVTGASVPETQANSGASVPGGKRGVNEGDKFTDFEVDGVKFSDFVGKGKYVLVDFWASWCGPCRMEIPNIKKVYNKHKGDRFDVLSVAVWDMPEDSKAAATQLGIVWNQMLNTGQIATTLYGIEGIPHIMLIGPDGTIIKRGLRGSEIEKAVSAALADGDKAK